MVVSLYDAYEACYGNTHFKRLVNFKDTWKAGLCITEIHKALVSNTSALRCPQKAFGTQVSLVKNVNVTALD